MTGESPADTPDTGGRPRPGWWRALLLASVAACAACGIVYELALLTLAASLGSGGIVTTSLIVAGFVASLGLGALLVKPLLTRPATAFVGVETTLGVVGGLSALLLYITFAYVGNPIWVLLAGTVAIGVLVGAEMPLLMTLLQHGRRSDARDVGSALANLNAADYLGALVGGLIWPFLLLPVSGTIRGTLVTGLVNLGAAALLALVVLRPLMSRREFLGSMAVLLAGAAISGMILVRADDIEFTSRQRLYRDPIIAVTQSRYQEIVVTRRGDDTRLYLDGGLQFSSVDEYRYTEALVYPVLRPDTRRVLVLGGGDGLAARELLRMPGVERIVQVELDPEVISLARGMLGGLNGRALDDPRVKVVIGDAFEWVRRGAPGEDTAFDAVIIDLPDPDNAVLARLYSTEFYELVRRVVAPGGRMVVQSGSPYSTTDAYWRTESTIRSAGWLTTPYHVHVPAFGDWGYVLAERGGTPRPTLPPGAPALRFLTPEVLRAATVFPPDAGPRDLAPSTIDRPRIVDDFRRGRR